MKKFNLIIGALFVALAFSSCKKEGCTDEVADNYSTEAKTDDGSCNYTTAIGIWWTEATADNLYNDGADVITFEIDGEIVGSMSTSTYNVTVPDCGANGVPGASFDLGNEKTKSITIKGYDQDGYLYWDTAIQLNGGECLQQEVSW
mgnify:CR=1 FL=1